MMGGLCLLVSYPKSGNTWMRLALNSLDKGGAPVDFSPADVPWWELNGASLLAGIISNRSWLDEFVGVESSELSMREIDRLRGDSIRLMLPDILQEYGEKPCFMKVHDAFHTADGVPAFPAEAISHVVYIVRDPRDVASSFADHMGLSLPEAVKAMADPDYTLAKQKKRAALQLPQRLSSWSAHVSGWLDSGLSLLLVRYEDMIADMAREMRRVADFVGMDVRDDDIGQAVEATRFDRLRAAEDAGAFREKSENSKHFFRKGKAGAWYTDLPPDLVAKIERDQGAVMCRLGYLPEKA